MTDLAEQLENDGWKVSPKGLETLTDGGKLTEKTEIIRKALNTDLRDLGGDGFPAEFAKIKNEIFEGPLVVQIQKIRNISAPKANQDSHGAPRMLKLYLTDGNQVCSAIELSPLQLIALHTPPGTKLRLKGKINVSSGLLLLTDNHVDFLGGIVKNLMDKWTFKRTLAEQTRGRYCSDGGPPPWIPFGEKIASTKLDDKNFRSLEDSNKENKDNDEFEAQRRDAIAEADKAATAKKVFRGGGKPLLDKNVQAIMEKGFTQQQAENALRQNKNNADRALKSLMKRTGRGGDDKEKGEKEGGGGGRNRRKGDEESGPKPSGKICLFQYVEGKLPSLPEKDVKEEKKEWEPTSSNYSNHNSYSTRGGRSDSGRSGGSRHRGGYNSHGSGGFNTQGSGGSSNNFFQSNSSRSSGGDERKQQNVKDDFARNHQTNSSSAVRWHHSQKPPRFQNQNKKSESSTEHFDHFISGKTDLSPFVASPSTPSTSNGPRPTNSNGVSASSYFANKANNNSASSPLQYNGFRNHFKLDNMGFNSQPQTEFRNQAYFKPPGMPDIPEFPYKDNLSFVPIVSNSGMSDMSDFVYKDSSPFKPLPTPSNSTGGKSHMNYRSDKYKWKIGDKCKAKYWEDNRYYDAQVTGVSNNTCVVRFLEYDNFEEVLQVDCIPVTEDANSALEPNFTADDMNSNFHQNSAKSNNYFTGVMPHDMRRSGSGGGGPGGSGNASRGAQPGSGNRSDRRNNQRYSQLNYTSPAGRYYK